MRWLPLLLIAACGCVHWVTDERAPAQCEEYLVLTQNGQEVYRECILLAQDTLTVQPGTEIGETGSLVVVVKGCTGESYIDATGTTRCRE